MTVAENVEYGLKVKKVPKAERRERAAEALAMVQLSAARRAQADAALRRAAAACGAGPCPGEPAESPVARRAARRARPQAPPGDADRAEGDPAAGGPDLHLRDARPGGSAHDERPPRRVQPRADRAGRTPGRRLRAAGDRVRRRVRGDVERAGGRRGRGRSPAIRTRSRSGRRRSRWSNPTRRCTTDDCTATGHVREVVYLGAATRYIVDAGRRGRARRHAAEPDDVVDGGAAGARQGGAPGVGSQEQPSGRGDRGFGEGSKGPEEGDA